MSINDTMMKERSDCLWKWSRAACSDACCSPVWLWLRARYEYSLLARVLRGIAQAWSRACAGSVLIQFVTREGCLSKAWKDSGLCRILTFLLSIPTILLQKLYGACREAFENSVAARIVFAVVEETPLAVAWLMLVIMVIPFKYWNNAYSFAGFLLCFLWRWPRACGSGTSGWIWPFWGPGLWPLGR